MAVAITNTKIAALNTDQALTYNAATADVANTAEAFTYTPTGKDSKIVMGIVNAGTAAMTASIAVGDGVFQAASANSITIAAGATDVIQFETGKYTSSAGTVVTTLTPGTGLKLLTDHAATVFVAELI